MILFLIPSTGGGLLFLCFWSIVMFTIEAPPSMSEELISLYNYKLIHHHDFIIIIICTLAKKRKWKQYLTLNKASMR